MDRYVCIHGHFYQPPRENPWFEEVELQESAHPYHDWNERITAECYAPNTASRIFDPEGKIANIVNNYAKISFNFSPTLLSWMEKRAPEVYRAIIEADKEGAEKFSGHGPAMAQAYSHLIMPLASSQDKRTQIIWGIEDFEHRFKRKPEGMWIPETAVDLETLDLMAEQGIKFSILAPHQARKVRRIGGEEWIDVGSGKIDFRMPYLCRLSSGRTINLFFYNEPISHAVAFEKLLSNGEIFARRLIDAFSGEREGAQLVSIATDGESYGHHSRFGDMALAYCLHHIESNDLARITVYAEYLEKHPPTHEVEIVENSSWGCAHGIERWRSDCGCKPGVNPGWTQRWRAPLREALDWLRDSLASVYEKGATKYLRDPWAARDEYIQIILDRSASNVERFFSKHLVQECSKEEKLKLLKLLEMQRYAMLMFTSCGWFFDEISEIGTIQILQYAARAMQLAKEVSGMDFKSDFVKMLGRAPSNIPQFGNGTRVYEIFVETAITDLIGIGACYALSSLFQKRPETVKFYCYTISGEEHTRTEAENRKLVVGKAHIRSDITSEESIVCYTASHLENLSIIGGACEFKGNDFFSYVQRELKNAVLEGKASELSRLMSKHFTHVCSFSQLFKDEQKKILNLMIEQPLKELEVLFRQMYEQCSPTMRVIKGAKIPLPKTIAAAMDYVLNASLCESLREGEFNRIRELVEEMRSWSFEPDKATLGFLASQKIDAYFEKFSETPGDISLLKNIVDALEILAPMNLELNLWKAQNVYFITRRRVYNQMRSRGDETANEWIKLFDKLGGYLGMK